MGPLKDNGKVYTEGKYKARILNSQFARVFSTNKEDIPLIQTQYANSSISNIDINRGNNQTIESIKSQWS